MGAAGLNDAAIQEYIRDREKAFIRQDRSNEKEYEDPFSGQQVKQYTRPLKGRGESNARRLERSRGKLRKRNSRSIKRKPAP